MSKSDFWYFSYIEYAKYSSLSKFEAVHVSLWHCFENDKILHARFDN
jgi:hypothetical protein